MGAAAIAVLSTEPQKGRREACALVPSGLKTVPLLTSSDITFTKAQNKVIKKSLLSQSKSTLSDVKKRWRVRIRCNLEPAFLAPFHRSMKRIWLIFV